MTNKEAIADLMLAQADVFYRPKDDSIDMAIIALKSQKTGHWEETDLDIYECSECHMGTSVWTKGNFCPNCGVKMVESQKSEENK